MHDGIIDVLDACPLEPETYNKFLIMTVVLIQLIPLYRNINSQILTVMELKIDGINVLTEPENYNEYLDTDGCPDVKGTTAGDILDTDYDGIIDL